MIDRHYCWMDPGKVAGRLIVPRSDPDEYESPADLLFESVENATLWRDEEIEEASGDIAELAYIRRWVLCIRTLETVEKET